MTDEKLREEHFRMYTTMFGNGEKGICEYLAEHETYIQQQKGAIKFVKWLTAAVTLNTIVLIITRFL
jgi:hypothetical protein